MVDYNGMNGFELIGIEMEMLILLDSIFFNFNKGYKNKVNMVVVFNLMFLVDYFDVII